MVLYKEFKVGDLFRLKSIRQIPRGFVPELKEDGEYPYLTQKTGGSYGVSGYVDETDGLELIEEPMIVTGVDNVANGVMYWWDKPFYANKMLGLINENLNRERAQYVITVLLKMYMGFDYNNKINMKIVRETVIQLPVKTLEDNEPDWEYMGENIKQKELAYIGNLNQEFEQKKEQLIELIGDESEYINIDDLPTAKFKVGDLFDRKLTLKGKLETSKEQTDKYSLRAITATNKNNGVGFYVEPKEHEELNKCLTVSANGANTGYIAYQSRPFAIAQDSYAMKLKDIYEIKGNKELVYLYISASISKYSEQIYNYQVKAGWNRLKLTYVELPINPEVSNLVPDWDAMERYIARIELQLLNRVINTLNT